jgi:hypothetical protein
MIDLLGFPSAVFLGVAGQYIYLTVDRVNTSTKLDWFPAAWVMRIDQGKVAAGARPDRAAPSHRSEV